jgi:hypothetical protein
MRELTNHEILLGMCGCFTIVVMWIIAVWMKLEHIEKEIDEIKKGPKD